MSDRTGRAAARVVAAVVLLGGGTTAWAGGFEAPGAGAEAMGRGGAFTAKADDGSALLYNLAGLARQRGTRLLLEGKLAFHSSDFSRGGVYPDAAGSTAWAQQPYPTVSDTNGISGAPLIALSSDFEYFDRWTFAIGLITPEAQDANRQYPSSVNGTWPAPQRYDLIWAKLLLPIPVLAAAVRVTKWLDIGLGLELLYGNFNLKATAFADLGTLCPGPESTQCDVILNIKTKGFTATGALGLMFHPLPALHIGLNVRGPIFLNTSGDVTASSPPALPAALDPGSEGNPAKATLPFRLPWVVRLGIRYAFMEGKREKGDIELDGTYEGWHEAEGTGDALSIPSLGPFSDIKATLLHHYKDTGSVRLGGAYNHLFKNDSELTVRLGLFYDSSATTSAYTRNDFDTLDKIGATVGLGFKIRGITINAAYAATTSPSRTVTDSNQRVINGVSGATVLNNGDPTSVFGNGKYTAQTHTAFLGLSFNIERIMKKERVLKYD